MSAAQLTPALPGPATGAPAALPGRLLAGLLLLAVIGGSAVALGELNALFICLALVASLFIALDFRTGVVLLIVLMPISASKIFPHGIAGITGLNPLNLLLFATLLACLAQRSLAGERRPLLPRPLLWRYVLPLVAAALIGFGHVGDIPSHFHAEGMIGFDSGGSYLRDMLLKPLFMVLFALLVSAAHVRADRLENFLLPMLLAVWAMALMTLVFVFLSGMSLGQLASPELRNFFAPLGMHANDLGRCYAVAYALMLFTFAASRDLALRLVLLGSMGMVMLALLLTFSRGAFLGFVIVNVLFLVSRRQILALVAGSLMLVGLALLLPGAVFERIGMGWEHGLDAISAGRIDGIWLPLLPEVMDSPIYGHGLGSILWSQAMRSGAILQVTHPHNAWLQAVLDTGVVGLALLSAYFVHVWRRFRALAADPALPPARRGFYQGAAAGLLAFLIAGFAGSSLMPVPEQIFLWLAIGMMYGEYARRTGEGHG